MRRFEFVKGTSAKFWSAEVDGSTFVVVYGRLGTAGQRKEKAFPTPAAATREYEKKVAEKLREGYHEVAAAAPAAAPPGAKGAAAASAKLELPPRLRPREVTPAAVQAAADALTALAAARGRRSWFLARRAHRARRVLSSVAGLNPAAEAALAPALDAVLARVIAPAAADRLPLTHALELLYQLDAVAFERAVQQAWKDPPPSSPAVAALAVLRRQLTDLGDAELALRFGALLVDRPGSEAGWTARWKALAPHLEAHLIRNGGSLKAYLKSIDAAGDPHVTHRITKMQAA